MREGEHKVPEVTVLVCVRTNLAARAVTSCAASLGVAGAVRTAVSEAEAMARLAESPVDVVLADTAVTRPDSVGFTRRVMARAPQATLVLFGPEDRPVAAAAVAAGARGVLRGADQDLVSVVAKALLLLLPAAAPAGPATLPTGHGTPAAASEGYPRGDAADTLTPMVPVQRSDPARGNPNGGHHAYPDISRSTPPASAPAGDPGAGTRGVAQPRRASLTERELQVLRGMADGKSNAEIGRELFVSEDTVKTHARRLFRKLGARDRAHAVAAGFRAGLVA
jgi:DNA-binding NarL/FixJ family response regulator